VRHQRDVSHRWVVAMAELTGLGGMRQEFFDGIQTRMERTVDPTLYSGIIKAGVLLQMRPNPRYQQRM
jgi:hypothetical protein